MGILFVMVIVVVVVVVVILYNIIEAVSDWESTETAKAKPSFQKCYPQQHASGKRAVPYTKPWSPKRYVSPGAQAAWFSQQQSLQRSQQQHHRHSGHSGGR